MSWGKLLAERPLGKVFSSNRKRIMRKFRITSCETYDPSLSGSTVGSFIL